MVEVEKLADDLVSLDVKQLIALKKVLKDKYGLEETIPVAAVAPVEEKAKVEEKTTYNIRLIKVSEVTAEKLNAVKIVNRILNVGLKAAMDMIKEGTVELGTNVPTIEAEQIKTELAALNAVVELY